jgi:plastocyanin
MQKNIVIFLGIVIIAGAWFLYSSKASAPTVSENTATAQQGAETGSVAGGGAVSQAMPAVGANANVKEMVVVNVPDTVISFTDAGFVPSSVTIQKGQTVRWANNSGSKVWPASAVHPSHAVYPQKSGSDCLGSSFDACKGLAQGESWDFTFENVGEWKFHNHLSASQRGTVNVTE